MDSRGLTSGEKDLARSTYGESIDYSEVQISDDGVIGGYGYTPNNARAVQR